MKIGEQDSQSLAVTSKGTVILLPVEIVKQIYAMEQVQEIAGKEEMCIRDSLDAVYVDDLKKNGLDEDFLAQFAAISKQLEEKKEENK